ncbi:cation:proton antiporter subunit C [Candidatus Oleimmundimicrobium sp.]|uniref:sodium:proton antiporter n=1 Tax=Candidatus Oleimmundimicrobium sp. TaxID=3060597 RepID=UPI002723BF75|nr:cation:proton antiporter subunit C [Candidatus Oleimmundimicrobium sp.]MDO8885885.1 cation:proton antiporter subunit C [Candidatus Oleimmundimicrobium sp.]
MSVSELFYKLNVNFNYVVAVTLFIIGLYAMISNPNLIKKFMGLNIMETSVFLFIVSSGAITGGKAPIIGEGLSSGTVFVNPIPQALILTGIVVAMSTTALALSLMIKLYEQCGTLNADKIKELK